MRCLKDWCVAAFLALLVVNSSGADWIPDASCPDQMTKVLDNLCIDCFFPMKVGVQIGGGGSGAIPDDAASPICVCPAPFPIFFRLGVTSGGWLPEGVLEVTPREYCSSTLGGAVVSDDLSRRGIGHWGNEITYNNVHYIRFPVGLIADLVMGFACSTGAGGGWGDVGVWSELDPTWNDPALAALKTPEMPFTDELVTLNVLTCAAEYVTMQANSNFFGSRWCTGGSGQTYPLTGYAVNSGNPTMIAGLQFTRLLEEMYRLGFQGKTWGDEGAICFDQPTYQTSIPKNGHRMQQVAPMGEGGNHRIGDDWNAGGAGLLPAVPGLRVQGHEVNNNNYIFIDWKYKECCVL